MSMHPTILELESLRRTYEVNMASSSSLDEAIERGWVKEEPHLQEQIDSGYAQASEAGEMLTRLMRELRASRSHLLTEWVALHTEACLNMLRDDMATDHDKAGVRAICLSDLLQGVAAQLQPSRRHFTVNTHYLHDYYGFYDAVVAHRHA